MILMIGLMVVSLVAGGVVGYLYGTKVKDAAALVAKDAAAVETQIKQL